MQDHSILMLRDPPGQPIIENSCPHPHVVGKPLGPGLAFQGKLYRIPDRFCRFISQDDAHAADYCLAAEGYVEGFVDTVHGYTCFPAVVGYRIHCFAFCAEPRR